MSFDPYHEWLLLPPGPRPPSPEALLGLQAGEMDRDRILAAAMKCAGIVRGYGLSKHREAAADLLREIAQAVQTLETRSAAHSAAQPDAPVPADVVDLTAPILEATPIDTAGEATGRANLAETVRRQGPATPPERQTVVPRDQTAGKHPTPPAHPPSVTSMEDLLAMLGGTVLVEPARPIPSMSGQRERQREREQNQKFLNTTVAISVTGAAVLLMAVMLWALLPRSEPSQRVANEEPKKPVVADSGNKRGSEAATAPSTDPGNTPKESATAPEEPDADADRKPPAISPPSASDPISPSAGPLAATGRQADMPAQLPSDQARREPSAPDAAKPIQKVPTRELPANALAGLYPAVDLPAIGDSAVARARATPVSLGTIDQEAGQLLEFTVAGSQSALSDTSLAGVPFVIERTRQAGTAGANAPSWVVALRGNAQQYAPFPKPLKDTYRRFERRVATIWWEDKELLFDWDAAQSPFFLEWVTEKETVSGSHGIEDSLRLCQLHVRGGGQSRAIALLKPRRLDSLRMNPARSETVRFLNVVMPPRVPARTPIVVRFTKLTGVKLEHTLAVDGGAFGANQAKLTFTQLTSDKIQNDLPLQATFVLQTRGSAGEESAVVCQPLSPASEEYRKVQEQRRRNIVERQYVRFAGTLQTHAEIHYRVFLNLQTHLVELGATDDAE